MRSRFFPDAIPPHWNSSFIRWGVPQKKLMESFQCRLLGVTTVYPGMNID